MRSDREVDGDSGGSGLRSFGRKIQTIQGRLQRAGVTSLPMEDFFFISARALLWAEELLMELLLLGRSFQECKLLLFILPYQPLYPLVIQSKYVGLSRIAPQKKNLFPRGVK